MKVTDMKPGKAYEIGGRVVAIVKSRPVACTCGGGKDKRMVHFKVEGASGFQHCDGNIKVRERKWSS